MCSDNANIINLADGECRFELHPVSMSFTPHIFVSKEDRAREIDRLLGKKSIIIEVRDRQEIPAGFVK